MIEIERSNSEIHVVYYFYPIDLEKFYPTHKTVISIVMKGGTAFE